MTDNGHTYNISIEGHPSEPREIPPAPKLIIDIIREDPKKFGEEVLDAVYKSIRHIEGEPDNRVYLSKRGLPLLYVNQPLDVLVITLENYTKWYGIYVVMPDGEVRTVDAGVIDMVMDKHRDALWVDHCFSPRLLFRLGQELGAYVDERAIEVAAGRWAIEQRNDEFLSDPSFDESPAGEVVRQEAPDFGKADFQHLQGNFYVVQNAAGYTTAAGHYVQEEANRNARLTGPVAVQEPSEDAEYPAVVAFFRRPSLGVNILESQFIQLDKMKDGLNKL